MAKAGATVEWVDGNLGSKVTMKYPAVFLLGEHAHGEVLSIAFAGKGQIQDTGAKMLHAAKNTTSIITSKSISKDGGQASYRGLVKVNKNSVGVKSKVVCDALLIDPESRSDTYPYIEVKEEKNVQVEHEATVSKINEEQVFYLMSRGLTESEAGNLIVNGFIEPFVKQMPMEYAVELNRLIEMEMEGSVG
jgi:Fe-S cluster assembly protein SufB